MSISVLVPFMYIPVPYVNYCLNPSFNQTHANAVLPVSYVHANIKPWITRTIRIADPASIFLSNRVKLTEQDPDYGLAEKVADLNKY